MAAAAAGAAMVEAADTDPLAAVAIRLNAARNRVPVSVLDTDVVGGSCRWDLLLCGDVCYEAPMTAHILPWLRSMAREAEVWLADPGRGYLPREGLIPLCSYTVPTTRELEDRESRDVTLYRLQPA
jgi:predicted nicotinamide N-methyase